MMLRRSILWTALLAFGLSGLPAGASAQTVAFVGATLWDGTDAPPARDATLIVEGGRFTSVGVGTSIPADASVVRLDGMYVIPGLVNAHGHVSGAWAPAGIVEERARIEAELLLFARYGVTTVASLGDGPAVLATPRDPGDAPRARLLAAGAVVAATEATQARRDAVDAAAAGADWLKLRVDDNLGSARKMPWDAVDAVMAVGRERGIPVATHLFYLDDAKRLLRMGSGMMAHSVRDVPVDGEFLDLMRERGVCYVPTLTREVSTFVYGSRPDFLDDPFFLQYANPGEVARVTDPEYMAEMAARPSAARYRVALRQALENLSRVSDAGIPVAMGTDTGPSGRFPGYFEHMELDLMAEAGLTPTEVLASATSVAADCIGRPDIGTIRPGALADFLVLSEDPTRHVAATRSLRQVFIGGRQVR